MPKTDISQTAISDMKSSVKDFNVSSKAIDERSAQKETFWENQFWPKYLGYYKQIPELKKAVDALAAWTCGKGWIADELTLIKLGIIRGWGEDSFDSIMQNMIIVKKINGDSFAEIIRDPEDGRLINLKPLNPAHIRIVIDSKGIIIRYEEYDPSLQKVKRELKPQQVLHLSNDRIANEIHGCSVITACQWIIDARNEAMSDWRRILHRSTIRVMYIDADNTTRLNDVKAQYAEAIKKGELLLIPAKKPEAEFEDLQAPPVQNFMEWIRYLENFFYQAVGVPKIILGGSQEFTEASSKIGYLTFEQVYMTEQRLLEQDLQNQLGIKIKFNRPASLQEDVASSEAANTGQVGFQMNEMTAQAGRVE